eukprot:COSAG06_NODE_21912_length_741_cov_0.778816_2_plen_106_part_00
MGHGTCINELDALELEEVSRAAERARVCTQRNSGSLVVYTYFKSFAFKYIQYMFADDDRQKIDAQSTSITCAPWPWPQPSGVKGLGCSASNWQTFPVVSHRIPCI